MKALLIIVCLFISPVIFSQNIEEKPKKFSFSISVNTPVIGVRMPVMNALDDQGYGDILRGGFFGGQVNYPKSNTSITFAFNLEYLLTNNLNIGLRAGLVEKGMARGFRNSFIYYRISYEVLEITPYAKVTTNNGRIFTKGGIGFFIIDGEHNSSQESVQNDFRRYRPGVSAGVGWNLIQQPKALLTFDIDYKGIIGKLPLGPHRSDIQAHSLLAGISCGIRF